MNHPPNALRPELEELLAPESAEVAARIRAVLSDVRPCVQLTTERVTPIPQRRNWFERLMRRKVTAPVLGVLASKFGGVPYIEHPNELHGASFLGQINFEDVHRALVAEGHPVPDGLPSKGLLAFDRTDKPSNRQWVGRTRWYASPDPTRAARPPADLDLVARFEASIRFHGG